VQIPSNHRLAFNENKNVQCLVLENNKTTEHVCYFHLNVGFEPFLDNTIPTYQTLDHTSLIECPIRAPNFLPYNFSVLWSKYVNNHREILFSDIMTLTEFSHYVHDPAEHDVYCCSLLKNNSVLIESNITIHINKNTKQNEEDLNSLWSLVVLLPVAILLGLLKQYLISNKSILLAPCKQFTECEHDFPDKNGICPCRKPLETLV
jgi:hypothetical protein